MRERLFKGFHPSENGTTEITINGEKIKGDWLSWNIWGRLEKSLFPLKFYADEIYIIHETVCEVVEINGSLFSEGDIIEALHPLSGNYVAQGVVRFGEFEGLNENKFVGFYIEWIDEYAVDYRKSIKWWIQNRSVEVIGNIFENPELLETKNE